MKRLLLLLAALIMILSASVAFAEEDPDAEIREWEEKYGGQRLWDYQINAAFAEQESWRYAWNPSMCPIIFHSVSTLFMTLSILFGFSLLCLGMDKSDLY